MKAIEKEIASTEGYSFPFEGEKHIGTIVELPYRKDTWREEGFYALLEFEKVIDAIREYERVFVVIHPDMDYQIARRFQKKNVTILRLPYGDSWARDNTPIFLKNKEEKIIGVDFSFNCWSSEDGPLYLDYKDDDLLSKRILLEMMINRYNATDMVLEGGSVLSDGKGTILTTEECLLSKGRNPRMSKSDIERNLKDKLQARKIIFLPYGVYNDETSGHIDNLAHFLSPNTVALLWCDDKDDPQYERSRIAKEILSNESDADGNPFNVITLPMPGPLYMTKKEEEGLREMNGSKTRKESDRLAGSYCNMYQGEKFVLLPQFNVEEDRIAYDIVSSFYKDKKKVIPIYSREILLGGGNIHCITKEIPYSPNIQLIEEI